MKIIADSSGNVCEGKYSIMNPPSIGVIIWATLISELLTPSIAPVSFCVTLFVNLLVKRGLLTPVPYARKISGTKTTRYSAENASATIEIIIENIPVTSARFSPKNRKMRAIKTVCITTLIMPIQTM